MQVLQNLCICDICGVDNMSNDGLKSIVAEKLDKNNFNAWKFKISNFFMGKGYWEYIEGDHEKVPYLPEEDATPQHIKAYKDWMKGSRKVMYWLSISV